jgi:pantoate--beta-alanine ligase
MKIFRFASELQVELKREKKENNLIGFVPTMGALHDGHLSLIQRANRENNLSVCSIFVNPTQFDNPKDLEHYPKTLEEDIKLLESVGCDYLYAPNAKDVYPNGLISRNFDFGGIENQMEGKFRRGHFDGVGTVVGRLFECCIPDKAYFGEKDFQQLQIIKKLTLLEHLNIEIIGCPIFREKDGLAMSSRNQRLSISQRNAAPRIYEILKEAKTLSKSMGLQQVSSWVSEQFIKETELALEYFSIAREDKLEEVSSLSKSVKSRAFIAVNAGEIRLIDNLPLD